ncbi:DNA recombination protein RmuC [Sapientia aquatica]|uniref:DNA recombination protein RmuC n=1 Tax=Sapientia aquatica TaxID=1549640 RepID=A0A4R5W5K4_9BURK|nr:DNA recombination protein RmuC [Sapientia aquatica]TDK68411.1 DNA recombination protein RmuC [Sapientia aquatica]
MDLNSAVVVSFLIGAVVGAIVVKFLVTNKLNQQQELLRQQRETELAVLTERLSSQTALAQQSAQTAQQQAHEARIKLDQQQTQLSDYQARVAELTARLDAERLQATEKLALLEAARSEFGHQFQLLANTILEEKSKKFTEQNQVNLGGILLPLQEKIKEFQTQVADTYDKDSKERLTLKNEIERLATLNGKISEDAINLTQALKGNNKTQGIWGEMVLETVLESSGLRRGEEYQVQNSFEREEGGLHRPDVIIHLPEQRHMIVDAKMSLVAYERYVSATNDEERAESLKQHLVSVRAHIKGLSDKNYQTLTGLKAPDFVMLFIAVEPAFMLAFSHDQSLFNDALAKNVLLVSPSTLLANLRTIAYIWRQEQQNRNAQEIAQQCAKLYDKFVGFVEDLDDVGKKLGQTQKSFDDAKSKLSTGRGNLIRQAEQVKNLGVKPTKNLPAQLLDDGGEHGEISKIS